MDLAGVFSKYEWKQLLRWFPHALKEPMHLTTGKIVYDSGVKVHDPEYFGLLWQRSRVGKKYLGLQMEHHMPKGVEEP